jgi:predicted flap endonuclease-1-like 5' DNA nuclease
MDYLLLQIFWFLLIAFLLGLAIGWFVGKGKSAVAEPDPATARRIAELEAEITRLKAPRGTPIEDIEGIGQGFGKQLRADGIASTEKLLEVCRTEAGIRKVCQCVGIDENTARNWATMADLMRIRGLGGQWSELLWRCGVTSVQDLATHDAAALVARMAEVNEAEHRTAELPGEHRVSQFITDAASLAPVLPNRDSS